MTTTPQGNQRFLDRFPTDQRSRASNLFLNVVRAGERESAAIVARASREVQTQIDTPRLDHETSEKLFAVLEAIERFPDEALDQAGYAVWWESLSKTEREHLKRAKANHCRVEWMYSQPPTADQLGLLNEDLGYEGTPSSMGEASSIISSILQAKRRRR